MALTLASLAGSVGGRATGSSAIGTLWVVLVSPVRVKNHPCGQRNSGRSAFANCWLLKGADLSGWALETVACVSADGKSVAGVGRNPDGCRGFCGDNECGPNPRGILAVRFRAWVAGMDKA